MKRHCVNLELFSDTKTSSGNSHTKYIDGIELFQEGNFFLDVTAASGTTPTLDVVIETYDPKTNKWYTIITFTQATAVTNEMKEKTANLGKRIAIKYTIGGTSPSFTFKVSAMLKS